MSEPRSISCGQSRDPKKDGDQRSATHPDPTRELTDSSYSDLAIHICWKVDREARMEPPIQTEYSALLSAVLWMLERKLLTPLRRADDLDLHGGRRERSDLFLHTVG